MQINEWVGFFTLCISASNQVTGMEFQREKKTKMGIHCKQHEQRLESHIQRNVEDATNDMRNFFRNYQSMESHR